MLESTFKFADPNLQSKRPLYDLELRRCADWKTAKRRTLIVLQNVHGLDLKNRALMSAAITKNTLTNCIKYARKLALPYRDNNPLPSSAFAVVNFNEHKHLDLPSGPRADAERAFAARVHKLIEKLQPTHVLISGDEAAHALFPKVDNIQYKRGWMFKQKEDWGTYTWSSTFDLSRTIGDDGEGDLANLLGIWCRHLAYLMMGKNPHDIGHVKSNPHSIKTLKQFDEMMDTLDVAKEVAFDTETKNLSVNANKLYTIQFATDEHTGHVLTVDHPLGHWSKKERKYIKKRLYKFFTKKNGPMLITFNGMFDLRIVRQVLEIPIMWQTIWEITAGEHLLDENTSALNEVSTMKDPDTGKQYKYGGLAAILCSYGNEHYYTAEFKKEDRGSIGSIDPLKKSFLEYAAMDAQSLIVMKREQIRRANTIEIAGRNYRKLFLRHMKYQMSDTVHTLSTLRADGSKIDKKYLKYLLSSESPLLVELAKTKAEFKLHKEVRQANKELMDESGFKAKSLFSTAKSWMFNLGKSDHKKKLFLDVLGLEPINKTKDGNPSIDKAFIARYKDKNKIISLYGDYQGITKLLSTYVKGWYKTIRQNLDAALDTHLRPDYSFWAVVTGRLASMKPNLQQIPSRGKLAKIIKRMFIAPEGYLLVRYDYSAHEVRMWAVAANDGVLASAFKVGQKLRKLFIQNPTDENKAAIKKDGDIHILNVRRFFNKIVDKDHPLRDAVKAVIFGVLYGKGPDTLGEDTKQGELAALKDKLSKAYNESLECKDPKRLKQLTKEIEEVDNQIAELMAEDRKGYAQKIIDKLFGEFKKGAAWTTKMQKLAEQEFYVYSPNGRRRYLPAGLTGDRGIIATQVRRGSNAPIQGFASELGIAAARLILETYYEHLDEFKKWAGQEEMSDWDMRVKYSRVVHDANYYAVPYSMVIPFIHLLQWCSTYGITERYEERFNLQFAVEPEIEVEVAAQDDKSYKWDWSIPNLIQGIESAVKDADALGVLTDKPDAVLEEILKPWRSKESRKYLQEHFPLLGVRKLDDQIKDAVKRKK